MSKIIGSLCILFVIACAQVTTDGKQRNQKAFKIDKELFRHGVASGDPLNDAVIIWTRVTTKQKIVTVKWEVSQSMDFNTIDKSGIQGTDASIDFTVKVDVSGLQPGTTYYYRFISEAKSSVIGRTKTLVEGTPEQVRLGIVSCSNYEFGYFNAYNKLASEPLDAILHLGDYIYEYGPDKYGDSSFTRKHIPPYEILSLEDYRIRYAQYREDKGLQNAHQNHPFIMIWDDHEIANNAYETGAQNHQENEGDFQERKVIAKKAYYEWQPIRENKDNELYRKFNFGNLVDVFMLDERYTGRNPPPETISEAAEPRSMLGAIQLNWFKTQLNNSTAAWKVVGNQVIFSPTDLSLVRPNSPVNLDAWDGYATERDNIIDFLKRRPVENVIFVTGDTHASWAFEVPSNLATYRKSGESCAIEIGTPSITSSNWDEGATKEDVIKGENALTLTNPHLKYVNGRDHGFTILTMDNKFATAQWYYSSDIKKEQADVVMAKEIKVQKGWSKFVE